MEKALLIMLVMSLNVLGLSAQKITSVKMLEQFYIDYFTYSPCLADTTKLDSLVNLYCTPDFVTAWNEDVNEIGLYDPLTNGFCDDYNMMKTTLSVREEDDYYIVSFNYLTWPDKKTKTESVIVYVNSDGKISHTKRPSDGYMTPDI